jgi:transcriptional regulator with XRE-family HTH domain
VHKKNQNFSTGGDKLTNPITLLREKTGLSRKDFAMLLNVNYSVVTGLETGIKNKVPTSMKEALRKLNMDPESLDRDYALWRQEQREKIQTSYQMSYASHLAPDKKQER